MNYTYGVIAVIVILAVVVAGGIFARRRPKHLNNEYYQKRWHAVQHLCGKSDTWPLAIINADKLLDDVLKKLHYKGKTMGERLVAAQHDLTDNDGVWYGHKFRNKLVHEEATPPLKQAAVRDILTSFRQAMKDLGAIQ
jgi:hypothetical protein